MIAHRAYDYDGEVLVSTLDNKRMIFKCTGEQYRKGLEAYKKGALIQNAFPFLSADEREFLISGITPDEWNKLFGEESSDG